MEIIYDILSYYFSKFPTFFFFIDFLRDLLLYLQIGILGYFLILNKNFKSFLISLSLLAAILIIGNFLKSFYSYPRPLTLYFPEGYSSFGTFPSLHTMTSFTISLILLVKNIKLGLLSITLTILVAIFSVLSFQHWLKDVLFGMLISLLIFSLFKKIFKSF